MEFIEIKNNEVNTRIKIQKKKLQILFFVSSNKINFTI